MPTANEIRDRFAKGERDFSGIALTGAVFRDAALPGINLAHSRLKAANLKGADLTGAKLVRAGLGMADLGSANLTDAELTAADGRGASLKGARLERAHVEGATFRGAELSGADLRKARLARADLSRTYARFADFSGADLRGADLQSADLSGANLRGASLRMAGLPGANLHGADLTGADLRGAVFSDTDLNDATLEHATVGGTIFADLDLRRVKGLGELNHAAPSTIGTDTFTRSHGSLPEAFLIGCGLRPWEIRTARAYDRESSAAALRASLADVRAQEPARRPRILVSHSQADAAFVKELQEKLLSLGLFSWASPHEAKGILRDKQSKLGIHHDVALVLVLSSQSVKSDWAEHEARLARKIEREEEGEDRVLFAIALDGSWKALTEPGRALEGVTADRVVSFESRDNEAHFEAGVLRLVSAISAA
jgi:uncharacterized protein YjbI with pentapeptide repeats